LLPYQQYYWWILGPPTVTTLVFVIQNLFFVLKYKMWQDLFWVASFFARYIYVYSRWLSGWEVFYLYLCFRFLESHWFTWVTSMSHLPRPLKTEHKDRDWVSLHLGSTQNVETSFFNDWFTGHLNFQIEHHLFPSMPRHQLRYVAPRVKQLCQKYGIEYKVRTLGECCMDILNKLVSVAKLWEKQRQLKDH